jgi:hypothetical protein
LQRSAAIGQYLRNVAPDRQRTIIARQCLLVTPAGGQSAADVVPSYRIVGLFWASRRQQISQVFPDEARKRARLLRVPQDALEVRSDLWSRRVIHEMEIPVEFGATSQSGDEDASLTNISQMSAGFHGSL